MTDAERARVLADKIESVDITLGFAGNTIAIRELGDPDLIIASLRRFAETEVRPAGDLREVVGEKSVKVPEPVYDAVERILDEKSAWVARPNSEVTMAIAIAATLSAMDAVKNLTDAERDVIATRRHQVAKGYDASHDDEHADGEIIYAPWGCAARLLNADIDGDPQLYRDRVVDAAAMAIAEVERLDRALTTWKEPAT